MRRIVILSISRSRFVMKRGVFQINPEDKGKPPPPVEVRDLTAGEKSISDGIN